MQTPNSHFYGLAVTNAMLISSTNPLPKVDLNPVSPEAGCIAEGPVLVAQPVSRSSNPARIIWAT